MTDFKQKIFPLPLLCLALVFLASAYFFGMTGLKTFLGFYFLLILPTYLLLSFLDIDQLERVIFSVFLGLIIAPLLIWYVDRIFHKLTLSMIIFALFAYGLVAYLHFKKKKTA